MIFWYTFCTVILSQHMYIITWVNLEALMLCVTVYTNLWSISYVLYMCCLISQRSQLLIHNKIYEQNIVKLHKCADLFFQSRLPTIELQLFLSVNSALEVKLTALKLRTTSHDKTFWFTRKKVVNSRGNFSNKCTFFARHKWNLSNEQLITNARLPEKHYHIGRKYMNYTTGRYLSKFMS